MNIHLKNAAEKLPGMATGVFSASLFLTMTSILVAQPQETWSCEETAYYSVYEDISRTESKKTLTSKALKWIDENTIGLESVLLVRTSPNSETFVNENSGSSLNINLTERPHIVVLTQPQVWMNKFGNLRVRFYRCTP